MALTMPLGIHWTARSDGPENATWNTPDGRSKGPHYAMWQPSNDSAILSTQPYSSIQIFSYTTWHHLAYFCMSLGHNPRLSVHHLALPTCFIVPPGNIGKTRRFSSATDTDNPFSIDFYGLWMNIKPSVMPKNLCDGCNKWINAGYPNHLYRIGESR